MRFQTALRLAAACIVCASTLGACGGGGSGDSPPPDTPTIPANRSAAAAATATSDTNACKDIRPFYWEVGDKTGAQASGSVNAPGNPVSYDANSQMAIASASKWLYGAYVAQRRAGNLTAQDIKHLNFQSGYTSFDSFDGCAPGQTVDECATAGSNGVYTAAHDGVFYYGGGHMQMHASQLGLGSMGSVALAAEMRGQLGADVPITFVQPQLAGGVRTTAAVYGRFLRKLLGGELQMGALLGSHPVCTNPVTCAQAASTPVPYNQSWHYSIGHWVEDDPVQGDGAFSSAGAFGFYPWIDAGRKNYGVVARQDSVPRSGLESQSCGKLIRHAWATGIAR